MKLNTNLKKCNNIHFFFKLHIKQLEYRIIENNNILLSANLFSLVNITLIIIFIFLYLLFDMEENRYCQEYARVSFAKKQNNIYV